MNFFQKKLQRIPPLWRYIELMLLIALGMSSLVIVVIAVCNWKPGEVGLLAIFFTAFGWFVGYRDFRDSLPTRPQVLWKELATSERSLLIASLLGLTAATLWLSSIAFRLVVDNLTWR